MTLLKKILFLKPILGKLLRLMTKRQKIQFALIVLLAIGLSLIETIGISAIIPFIAVVSDASLLESGFYEKAFEFFGFDSPERFIIVFGIGIIIFYFFRGAYSFLHVYVIKRYSNAIYKCLSKKAFKVSLSVPYKEFTRKNTGELMQAISAETRMVSLTVLHILKFFTEIFTIIMVYSVIVLLNWRMTLIITLVLLFFILIMMSFLTKIASTQGRKKIKAGRKKARILKESLSNIKYIKLKGSEDDIIDNYSHEVDIQNKSLLLKYIVNATPKNILETLGFSFLIAVVLFVVWLYNDESMMIIPTVTMYALALFRILPSVQRALGEINHIAFSEEVIKKVYQTMHQNTEKERNEPIDFKESVRLENICFQYMTGGVDIIKNVTLEIKKGEKIAFTGESGGGKSTLVDIITGIHKPVSGTIFIDNAALTNDNIREWRKKIGYIPQTTYLFDGTVAENVSFGSIHDDAMIKSALIKANIWDFLSQKDGINTLVGDAGVQLSGGQQQRICIARALYNEPEILVLDEATSALDTETEQKIMGEIYAVSANKTLIVIAHRLTTLEHCDRRILIENGKIVREEEET